MAQVVSYEKRQSRSTARHHVTKAKEAGQLGVGFLAGAVFRWWVAAGASDIWHPPRASPHFGCRQPGQTVGAYCNPRRSEP